MGATARTPSRAGDDAARGAGVTMEAVEVMVPRCATVLPPTFPPATTGRSAREGVVRPRRRHGPAVGPTTATAVRRSNEMLGSWPHGAARRHLPRRTPRRPCRCGWAADGADHR